VVRGVEVEVEGSRVVAVPVAAVAVLAPAVAGRPVRVVAGSRPEAAPRVPAVVLVAVAGEASPVVAVPVAVAGEASPVVAVPVAVRAAASPAVVVPVRSSAPGARRSAVAAKS
jgi:hypothetical protein